MIPFQGICLLVFFCPRALPWALLWFPSGEPVISQILIQDDYFNSKSFEN